MWKCKIGVLRIVELEGDVGRTAGVADEGQICLRGWGSRALRSRTASGQ